MAAQGEQTWPSVENFSGRQWEGSHGRRHAEKGRPRMPPGHRSKPNSLEAPPRCVARVVYRVGRMLGLMGSADSGDEVIRVGVTGVPRARRDIDRTGGAPRRPRMCRGGA